MTIYILLLKLRVRTAITKRCFCFCPFNLLYVKVYQTQVIYSQCQLFTEPITHKPFSIFEELNTTENCRIAKLMGYHLTTWAAKYFATTQQQYWQQQ